MPGVYRSPGDRQKAARGLCRALGSARAIREERGLDALVTEVLEREGGLAPRRRVAAGGDPQFA